jgi:hypothetical protein
VLYQAELLSDRAGTATKNPPANLDDRYYNIEKNFSSSFYACRKAADALPLAATADRHIVKSWLVG